MDDLISRQAAIDELDKGAWGVEWDKTLAKTMIESLPSAQPERKKGKWIDETFKPRGLVYHPYKCNQCGEHSEADSNFCPNCGADMRGDKDDESRSNSNAQTDTRARGMGATDKSSGI